MFVLTVLMSLTVLTPGSGGTLPLPSPTTAVTSDRDILHIVSFLIVSNWIEFWRELWQYLKRAGNSRSQSNLLQISSTVYF